MNDLQGLNVWLGIIAIVSLLEFLMIVTGLIVAYRLYRKVSDTLTEIRTHTIAPLAARVDAVAAEVHDVVTRVQRADDAVRGALARVSEGASKAAVVVQRGWPILAGWKAISAAVRTFTRNGRTEPVEPVVRMAPTGSDRW
jgi:hypothetical protein